VHYCGTTLGVSPGGIVLILRNPRNGTHHQFSVQTAKSAESSCALWTNQTPVSFGRHPLGWWRRALPLAAVHDVIAGVRGSCSSCWRSYCGPVVTADVIGRSRLSLAQRPASKSWLSILHMLRHACGYRGTDNRLIQDYLGHKNMQHTVRYTKLSAN
jgi:hypothetical protein